MDTGLLVVRLVVGSLMAAHGAQKLFGWFGGHGLAGVAGYFESLGFRPIERYRPDELVDTRFYELQLKERA